MDEANSNFKSSKFTLNLWRKAENENFSDSWIKSVRIGHVEWKV